MSESLKHIEEERLALEYFDVLISHDIIKYYIMNIKISKYSIKISTVLRENL